MATYDLEEQEQLAEIKAWWKAYGNLVVNALTVAAVVVIAWQSWNWYQRSQSAQASMVYDVLQKAVYEKDAQRITAASGELLEKFGGSDYAALGALTAAKAMVDAGDGKTAKLKLLWVVEHSKHELRELARLRLVALLFDEKAYDEALKQLASPFAPEYAAVVADRKGDVLVMQGKKQEAIAEYSLAYKNIPESVEYRRLIEVKLNALGVQPQAVAVAATPEGVK